MERTDKTVSPDWVKPNPRNARTHTKRQVEEVARIIRDCGWTAPIIVDESGVLIAGHLRLQAARVLNMTEIPAVIVSGLSEAKKRALMLADNKVALKSGYDRELLAIELPELQVLLTEEGLDLGLTGFEPFEVDALVTDFEEDASDPADDLSRAWKGPPVSIAGDLWILGRHRLLCGDARSETDLARLMGAERARMAFLDIPFNRAVRAIGGRGRTRHAEFAMASGEMSTEEFRGFIALVTGRAAAVSFEGAVSYVCIDWRGVADLVEAGGQTYGAMLNLVVWAKTNAGQGSFYRSEHELIGVFRVGDPPHLNNVKLGAGGRNRSNVWRYAGVNSFRAGRMDELGSHPTAKPVALVADAMKDCTARGDVVLDTFCGSGTTIMAAERVGRLGFGLEIEPHYVDVAIRRWGAFTRRDAVHAETGQTFADVARERAAPQGAPGGTEDVGHG